MPLFQFLDHLIPYDTFLNDLAARIVKLLKADHDDPEYISQRKAYQMFGRRNVERWRRQGKSCPVKGRERLNTGQPNCASYNVPYKITLTGNHQIAIISKMKMQNNKLFYGYI